MKCGCSNPYTSCENPSRSAECDDAGDTGATCVSGSWPSYSCSCTQGFHEEGGVCVDTNACSAHLTQSGIDKCKVAGDSGASCRDLSAPQIGIACDCSTGFVDVGGVCTEQQCSPINLEPNVISTTSCESLTTVSKPSCSLACEAGYHGNNEDARAICPPDSLSGTVPSTSFSCIENECDIFSFLNILGAERASAVEGDPTHNHACTDGLTLTAIGRPSCDLRCKEGYTLQSGTPQATCSIDGGLSSSDINCVENVCSEYAMPPGIRGDMNSTDPCVQNISLSAVTNPSCMLECDEGYEIDSGVSMLFCDIEGGSPRTNLVCRQVDASYFSSDEEMWMYAGGASLTAVVFFLCILCVVCCCMHRRAKKSGRKIDELQSIVAHRDKDLESKLRDIELMARAWQINFEDVEIVDDAPIASGAFGSVWRATYRNAPVALKKMRLTEDVDLMNENEIRFLQRVNHPRVLKFIGCGTMHDDNLFCVLEWMSDGSLSDFLKRAAEHDAAPSWGTRLRLLGDCVEGMVYLHENIDSIHRDLKSANLLLAEEKGVLRAKVADFGMSKMTTTSRAIEDDRDTCAIDVVLNADEQGSTRGMSVCSNSSSSGSLPYSSPSSSLQLTMTSGCGTPVYMAPEIWRSIKENSTKLTKKIDCYSFAIIMWETLELKQPWSFAEYSYQIADFVEKGVRPAVSLPRHHSDLEGNFPPPSFYNLLSECWDDDISMRPSFIDIRRRIQRTWNKPSGAPASVSLRMLFPKTASSDNGRASKRSELTPVYQSKFGTNAAGKKWWQEDARHSSSLNEPPAFSEASRKTTAAAAAAATKKVRPRPPVPKKKSERRTKRKAPAAPPKRNSGLGKAPAPPPKPFSK